MRPARTHRPTVPLLPCIALALACGGEHALRATDSAAARTGFAPADTAPHVPRVVTVRLADGHVRTFADSGFEESAVMHKDAGRLPRVPLHVVSREMWEAWDYVLVDLRTGDTTAVPDTPVVSPGGVRLAVTSMDFENGYAPTVVEIWRVEPDGIRLEWREKSGESYPDNTGWGASDLRWLDDSTAAFMRTVPRGEDGPHETGPARLLLREGRWRMVPGPG